MSEKQEGTVLGLALRTARRGPIELVEEVTAVENGGIESNRDVEPHRGITFISSEQWSEVQQELEVPELPWHTRRANVLVEGLVMTDLMGKTLEIGEVVVDVEKETEPCGLMDKLHNGLRKTLEPDCRGGVHGRVMRGGRFCVGDTITVR
jgi:MOSC domain-containing protein YiiM